LKKNTEVTNTKSIKPSQRVELGLTRKAENGEKKKKLTRNFIRISFLIKKYMVGTVNDIEILFINIGRWRKKNIMPRIKKKSQLKPTAT